MMENRLSMAFYAARNGRGADLAELLAADPRLISARGDRAVTLLHVAAEQNDVELTRSLLAAGADIEAEAAWGQTPLEWAANMASTDAASALLAAGAGRLNLWTAAALGMLPQVEACFDGAALRSDTSRRPSGDFDLSGWPEDTPFRRGDAVSDAFHIASRNGHVAVADFLLRMGADVDATGYFGATGLHWAAIAGREEIVSWLLSAGADPSRIDPKFGATPAGWAREGGHDDLATLLEVAG